MPRKPGKTTARLDHEIAEALAGHGTIVNRGEIPDRALRALGAELDEAAERAVRAGAVGGLEYQGAGSTGVVFCDTRGTAYKVARRGREDAVSEEAEWLARAAQVPGVRERVARGARYDRRHHVLVRECVRGPTGTPRQTSKLFDVHGDIRKTMMPYGWLAPEFKEDSYVLARGRGPVLVDASSAVRVGGELVRYAQDVLAGRRVQAERLEDIAWAVRQERGGSIPEAVADRLLAKLRARGVDT